MEKEKHITNSKKRKRKDETKEIERRRVQQLH